MIEVIRIPRPEDDPVIYALPEGDSIRIVDGCLLIMQGGTEWPIYAYAPGQWAFAGWGHGDNRPY